MDNSIYNDNFVFYSYFSRTINNRRNKKGKNFIFGRFVVFCDNSILFNIMVVLILSYEYL